VKNFITNWLEVCEKKCNTVSCLYRQPEHTADDTSWQTDRFASTLDNIKVTNKLYSKYYFEIGGNFTKFF